MSERGWLVGAAGAVESSSDAWGGPGCTLAMDPYPGSAGQGCSLATNPFPAGAIVGGWNGNGAVAGGDNGEYYRGEGGRRGGMGGAGGAEEVRGARAGGRGSGRMWARGPG